MPVLTLTPGKLLRVGDHIGIKLLKNEEGVITIRVAAPKCVKIRRTECAALEREYTDFDHQPLAIDNDWRSKN